MEVNEKITGSSVSMDGLHAFVTFTTIDNEGNKTNVFEKAYIVSSGNKGDLDALINEDKKRLENAFELQENLEER